MECVPAGALSTGDVAFQIIPNEQRLFRRDAEAVQCVFKNPRIGFVRADLAGCDDLTETAREPEMLQNRVQAAIEIGQDGELEPWGERGEHFLDFWEKGPDARLLEFIVNRVEISLAIKSLGQIELSEHFENQIMPPAAVIILARPSARRPTWHLPPNRTETFHYR